MQQLLTKYEEIAQVLQDGMALEQLAQVREQLEEKHYYVPIIGQFSSGKSSLLNNLLGRRFLPTMLSETTAFSTFIYYSETEYAEIVTKSMGVHTFMVEKLMDLSQRSLNSPYAISEILKLSAIENTDILCLNVYLKNPLLHSGIVFVDTPGLNTIISTHENRTMDLLPRAHSILYVMGKALTAADAKFVSAIHEMGIDLFFVRTKLDELRTDENDTPAKIMEADRANIESTLNMPVTYFGLSNEEQYKELPQWSVLINELKVYLHDELAEKVDERRLQSVQRRLMPLQEKFVANVEQRLQQVVMSNNVSDADIQKKINSLEGEMEYVESRVSKQESHFKRHFEVVQQNILEQFTIEQQNVTKQYEKVLNTLPNLQSLQEQSEGLAAAYISEAANRLSNMTNEELNAFLKAASTDTNEALQTTTDSFSLGSMPNISLAVTVPTIGDIFEKGQLIHERLSDVNYEEELAQLEKKRREVEVQGGTINQNFEQAKVQLDEIGNYEARYIEQSMNDKQQTMKTLGNAIDWAMLFIPGKAFSTGAVKIAGTLNKVAKGKKYADTVAKVAQTVVKAGQVLEKTDKAKDLVKFARSTQQEESYRQNDKFNILNMLSVEYWFEKAGKAMDGPPNMVEDEEYRLQYNQQRENILSKIEHAKQLEMTRLKKLEIINTQEERLREEKRLDEKYKQELDKQLYEAQKQHEQMLEQKKVAAYRVQLIEAFNGQTKKLFDSYKDSTKQYLQSFIEHVPAVISLELQQQLHTQKAQLEELIETRQQSQEQQQQYRLQLESYKQLLAK